MARWAGCQQGGPSSASSMPSGRATHPAPACLIMPVGRQSSHQAKPGLEADGVVNAAPTGEARQLQHLRGWADRSALERVAASP
eukprot:7904532-Alexandrium_andersonii.AAC.1